MQKEIIEKAIAQTVTRKPGGKKTKAAFLEWLAENDQGISRVTLDKWLKGEQRPMSRILKDLMRAYPENDPRHQFAKDLMALQSRG